MLRVSLTSMARFSPEKLQKVPLFESPRFFCDLYCLSPGQAQRLHAHADSDKVYCVLAGHATIQVGEEEAEAAEGEAVLAPAGVPHGVANRTDASVTLLVFMAPRPAHG